MTGKNKAKPTKTFKETQQQLTSAEKKPEVNVISLILLRQKIIIKTEKPNLIIKRKERIN